MRKFGNSEFSTKYANFKRGPTDDDEREGYAHEER